MPDACTEERQQRPLRGGEALRAMAAGVSSWPVPAAMPAPSAVGEVLERLARLQTQLHQLGQPPAPGESPAPFAREDGRRSLRHSAAALGAVVRRLDQEADAIGAGAERLMQQAQAMREALPGEEQGRLLNTLERLEARLQRLEQQPAPRPAASRDLDGLRQLALGFRLALQEVQIGARALEDAAAAVRPAAEASDSWRTALAALRDDLAADRREAAAPMLGALEALRTEVAALTARKPGAAVSLEADRAELRRLLLGFKSVLERLEGQDPASADASPTIARVGAEVGEAIARHVKHAIAEALAFQQKCERGFAAEHAAVPMQAGPEPVGGAPAHQTGAEREAIEALGARIARLHADLNERAGAAEPDAAVLLREARACCGEMLDIAVALTRELAPAPESSPPKPARAASRGLLARRSLTER